MTKYSRWKEIIKCIRLIENYIAKWDEDKIISVSSKSCVLKNGNKEFILKILYKDK